MPSLSSSAVKSSSLVCEHVFSFLHSLYLWGPLRHTITLCWTLEELPSWLSRWFYHFSSQLAGYGVSDFSTSLLLSVSLVIALQVGLRSFCLPSSHGWKPKATFHELIARLRSCFGDMAIQALPVWKPGLFSNHRVASVLFVFCIPPLPQVENLYSVSHLQILFLPSQWKYLEPKFFQSQRDQLACFCREFTYDSESHLGNKVSTMEI